MQFDPNEAGRSTQVGRTPSASARTTPQPSATAATLTELVGYSEAPPATSRGRCSVSGSLVRR